MDVGFIGLGMDGRQHGVESSDRGACAPRARHSPPGGGAASGGGGGLDGHAARGRGGVRCRVPVAARPGEVEAVGWPDDLIEGMSKGSAWFDSRPIRRRSSAGCMRVQGKGRRRDGRAGERGPSARKRANSRSGSAATRRSSTATSPCRRPRRPGVLVGPSARAPSPSSCTMHELRHPRRDGGNVHASASRPASTPRPVGAARQGARPPPDVRPPMESSSSASTARRVRAEAGDKDVILATELGREVGVPMRLSNMARKR